jgi:hypothetical protein
MADITIASTTDTQDDVNRAAGLAATETQEQSQPEEQETLTTTQETEGGEHEEVEGEEQPNVAQRRPKNAVQKRIDKLTAKNYALEEEREELRSRLERLERTVNQPPANQQQPEGPQFAKPRPKESDYEKYDEFVEALTDWKVEKKDFDKVQEEVKVQQTVQQQRQAETFKTYNQAVAQARGVHEDFDEVVGREDLTLPMAVQVAIIGMGNKGPEISYQIAQDEEFCNHLSNIAVERGDAVALTEFGRWLASVESPEVGVAGGEEETRQVARRGLAPQPIRPVGNSSTRSQLSMDELPFRDYRRIRDEAEKARFRR